MKNITTRHRRFVEQYCTHFNGARAAREAGYAEKHARTQASRLLSDADISALVEERLEDLAMSAAEATKRLADIARSDISEFFRVEEGTLVLDVEAVAESGAVVQQVKLDTEGAHTIKLYDAKDALKTILDAHGAFNHTQEFEHSGPDGKAVPLTWYDPDSEEPDA